MRAILYGWVLGKIAFPLWVEASCFCTGQLLTISQRLGGLGAKKVASGSDRVGTIFVEQCWWSDDESDISNLRLWTWHHGGMQSSIYEEFPFLNWEFPGLRAFQCSSHWRVLFSKAKMNRLILLLGPIAAALGGVGLANAVAWALRQWREPEVSAAEAKPLQPKGGDGWSILVIANWSLICLKHANFGKSNTCSKINSQDCRAIWTEGARKMAAQNSSQFNHFILRKGVNLQGHQKRIDKCHMDFSLKRPGQA